LRDYVHGRSVAEIVIGDVGFVAMVADARSRGFARINAEQGLIAPERLLGGSASFTLILIG